MHPVVMIGSDASGKSTAWITPMTASPESWDRASATMDSEAGNTSQVLVVVPCGKAKIWDREPGRGPTAARDAYAGGPFKLNRAYAERFADRWIILSAKYGFLVPDHTIPGPYEVSFLKPASGPVSVATLRTQVTAIGLDRFPVVVGLGGAAYRAAVAKAFAGTGARLVFPFAGLPVGYAMQAAKRAVAAGAPGFAVVTTD